MRDEDVVRLSPLGFDHINMLGRRATPAFPVMRAEMHFRFPYYRTPGIGAEKTALAAAKDCIDQGKA